ncbi:MAG: hypothetical protein WAL84_13995 [Candidatus Dormiibacterota bacterium]
MALVAEVVRRRSPGASHHRDAMARVVRPFTSAFHVHSRGGSSHRQGVPRAVMGEHRMNR